MAKSKNIELVRATFIVLLLITCVVFTYYFHFILNSEIIFTHFFYIPIILASLWWSRTGIAVAVFLAILLVVSNIIRSSELFILTDLVRASMFIVIGTVISILNETRLAKSLELEHANRCLLEADKFKSIFIANMSHELRTPLNSIIGFTDIILDGISGEINMEQKKQLTMVAGSADHLLNLINDILDISKIEAGKLDLYIEEISFNTIVKDVFKTISPQASEKRLELITDVPEGIKIYSDRKRLKQILLNLVGNAVKFTESGSVKVTAKISGREK